VSNKREKIKEKYYPGALGGSHAKGAGNGKRREGTMAEEVSGKGGGG